MESLLRWGIANSDPRTDNQPPPQPRSDLDPAIIDMILGKSDAELMKEALTIAVDETKDEDDRLQALDNFEMLIEHIDNANNLEKLRMWEPLHALLINPASSAEIQTQVLWVLGTAMQNNPAAQHSYLALSPLRTILSFLSPSVPSKQTRSKAAYTLSGLLKHNAAAVDQMDDAGGWDVLRAGLQDPDIGVRRKVAFLLNTLLTPTGGEDEEIPANVQQPLQVPTSAQGVSVAAIAPPPAPSSTSTSLGLSAPVSQTSSQAVTLHPSSPSSSAVATPAAPALSPLQTVHPNSHASLLSDPRSASTSAATARALERTGLLGALVSALAQPVPHGPDGETEGDADFEEKVLRGLHTYTTGGRRTLPKEDASALARYLDEQESKEGGEEQLAEKWNFTKEEVQELKQAAKATT
ncbi:nucleotide exchange factors-like protein [Trametes versicolor FP-101664 SS1]|uniref:nucleotide exchange factors-like protein n=1 Tax=Trametes versicolor (strain FP-101664) TaxID=717944 RepID=UPI0004622747|nr:nucleotide exchange factors-like protein [Trametes versicolor FP-101664 SS1]EIW56471.1 nucleotide exchange factors-like protein [Trametes versicolor FP-101664 SS1]